MAEWVLKMTDIGNGQTNRRVPMKNQMRSKRNRKLLVGLNRKHHTHQTAMRAQYVMGCMRKQGMAV